MQEVARPKPFIVGANMPWGQWCGHDFGLHPHGWGSERQDWAGIERELKALRALGITVVRWFILASGVNYPCPMSADIPREAGSEGRVPQVIDAYTRRVPRSMPRLSLGRLPFVPQRDDFEFEWTAPPTPLSDAFLADFVALCRACQAADVQLIPSLLSFEWFHAATHQDKGVYGGGRGRLIFGPAGASDVTAHVRAFLAATLAPLLACTTQAFGRPTLLDKHPIFAWESINEPDWVTQGGPHLVQQPRQPVTARNMNVLLQACRQLALDAGYDHTIGFKQFAPRWLEPALRAALIADGTRYWHQGHHYPTLRLRGRFEHALATNASLPRPHAYRQCLVGEFATGQGSRRSLSNWPWADPELRDSERDPQRYLVERLRLIESRGYAGALLWSATADARDPRNAWNENTRRQVAGFARQAQR